MTEDKDIDIELKDEERTPCEIWTRVMGYHRPISSYNIGKLGEAEERVYFTEQAIARHLEAENNDRKDDL